MGGNVNNPVRMFHYLIIAITVAIGLSLIGIGQCEDSSSIPIHFSHGNDNQGSEEEVRLEDFFWTGSGDGPPEYIKKVHKINNGKEVIVKTETIVATVYLDKDNEMDTICLDCAKDTSFLPLNYTTTDRRYWLLTVLGGFLRVRDIPLIEDKLAKLYRIAFTRQQSRHLGILNATSRINNDILRERRNSNEERNVSSLEIDNENIETFDKNVPYSDNIQSLKNLNRTTVLIASNISKSLDNSSLSLPSEDVVLLPINTTSIVKENSTSGRYTWQGNDDHQVRVIIHNLTIITEDDIQHWDESGYSQEKEKRLSRPFANQTEIIYSVFYNGKPVLATTAAEDMKLVTDGEVETIMEKEIFMKAEPYLKEPQATPLIPATKNNKGGFFWITNYNPILITITSIAIVLLLLLFVALILVTRAKRQRSAEVKRLSSRQGLLIEHGFDTTRTHRDAVVDTSRTEPEEDGIHNQAYERDLSPRRKDGSPSIEFPQPPPSRSRPSSSSTSTSDSSIYCPINRPNVDLQNMLDEKAAKLFEKKKRSVRLNTEDKTEAVYTTVGREKKMKHKQKKKYLSENRVGSIEEHPTRSPDHLSSNDSSSDGYRQHYDGYEPHDTYNLSNNYHRNKILQNRVFTDRVYDTVNESISSPTQAINREIIKVLQGGEKQSSESGSIGSYLSMASVKSFPRNILPEPLHRVLEPVSVTYYDNYEDATLTTFKKPKPNKSVTLVNNNTKPTAGAAPAIAAATDESMPRVQMISHSDNPDPGVIGPIVWEIHKKNRQQTQQSESPIHDPALSRNRYEGLLEGAIQLYSSPEQTPKLSKSRNSSFTRSKENRGKSAIVTSDPYRLSRTNSEARPLTAGLEKTDSNYSTQPPSPNGRAWRSGTPSPLVRPLSAGPFHRPEPPVVDVTRILANQPTDKSHISAAPLIEAIQNELKKFKRESSQ